MTPHHRFLPGLPVALRWASDLLPLALNRVDEVVGMHEMVEVSNVGDEHLFHCFVEHCGHQILFRRSDLSVTVLTSGDVFARHTGSTSPELLTVGIGSH